MHEKFKNKLNINIRTKYLNKKILPIGIHHDKITFRLPSKLRQYPEVDLLWNGLLNSIENKLNNDIHEKIRK